jgi:predicted DNA-binding protein with PD1-like motif
LSITSPFKIHALRLVPGEDLRASVITFARGNNIAAAFILSCAGSLAQTSIRFANQKATAVKNGFFEIISLNGTLSKDGCHLHIAIANEKGEVIGGHVMDGNIINTTAEIVIGEIPGLVFSREHDRTTGYAELKINSQKC